MNTKKVWMLLGLLALVCGLWAEINFTEPVSLEPLNTDDKLVNVQLFDVNGDNTEETVCFYRQGEDDFYEMSNDSLWCVVAFDANGDTVLTRIMAIEETGQRLFHGQLVEYNDEILWLTCLSKIGEYHKELSMIIFDFDTMNQRASNILTEEDDELFSALGGEFTVLHGNIHSFEQADNLFLLMGIRFNSYQFPLLDAPMVCKMKYGQNQLRYLGKYESCGDAFTWLPEQNAFISAGYTSIYDWGEMNSSTDTKGIVKKITADTAIVTEEEPVFSLMGGKIHGEFGTEYHNYVHYFNLLTNNDPFGEIAILHTRITNPSDFSYAFAGFTPDFSTIVWTADEAPSSTPSPIIASALLTASNEQLQVLYFRENKTLEVRKALTGRFAFADTVDFAVHEILRKQDNSLFFVTVDENTLHCRQMDGPLMVPAETVLPLPRVQPIALSNYPNPFNPETTIQFNLPQSGNVELTIYNIKGQRVKTLLSEDRVAGMHSIVWSGQNEAGEHVASGLYFYRLNLNGQTQAVKKMMLMK